MSKENLQIQEKIANNAPDISILNSTNSRHGMYIVDGSKFLRVELVKPEAENFLEAIGFAVYSNNERSAELFRWMFELLWNERILSEESKRDHKMQEEFVSIAAHELRSPAQSILGYTELILADPKYTEVDTEQRFLDAIYRNSIRLGKLTKELLDLTRIENQTLQLHKQKFNLKDIIQLVIQDIQKQKQALSRRANEDYGDAKIILLPLSVEKGYDRSNDIFVVADMPLIVQVLTNLLENALKFTREKSTITINIQEEGNEKNEASYSQYER